MGSLQQITVAHIVFCPACFNPQYSQVTISSTWPSSSHLIFAGHMPTTGAFLVTSSTARRAAFLFFQQAIMFLYPFLWDQNQMGVLCPLICCYKLHLKLSGVTWMVSSAGFHVSTVPRLCATGYWSVQSHTVSILHRLYRGSITKLNEGWKLFNNAVSPQVICTCSTMLGRGNRWILL